jgi:hypothetical protein
MMNDEVAEAANFSLRHSSFSIRDSLLLSAEIPGALAV